MKWKNPFSTSPAEPLVATWARIQVARADSFLRNLPYNWYASCVNRLPNEVVDHQSMVDIKLLAEFERSLWFSVIDAMEKKQ